MTHPGAEAAPPWRGGRADTDPPGPQALVISDRAVAQSKRPVETTWSHIEDRSAVL